MTLSVGPTVSVGGEYSSMNARVSAYTLYVIIMSFSTLHYSPMAYDMIKTTEFFAISFSLLDVDPNGVPFLKRRTSQGNELALDNE